MKQGMKLTAEQQLAVEEGRATVEEDGTLTFGVSFPKGGSARPPAFVQDEEASRICAGREVLDAVGKSNLWTRSRVVVVDGLPQTILQLLAIRKFTTWGPDQFPYWKDRDYHNESLENVELASRPVGKRKKGSKYGVPAGSKEYWRAYRADPENKEKMKASQRKYYRKQRAELKELAELRKIGKPESPEAVRAATLDEILKSVK